MKYLFLILILLSGCNPKTDFTADEVEHYRKMITDRGWSCNRISYMYQQTPKTPIKISCINGAMTFKNYKVVKNIYGQEIIKEDK